MPPPTINAAPSVFTTFPRFGVEPDPAASYARTGRRVKRGVLFAPERSTDVKDHPAKSGDKGDEGEGRGDEGLARGGHCVSPFDDGRMPSKRPARCALAHTWEW